MISPCDPKSGGESLESPIRPLVASLQEIPDPRHPQGRRVVTRFEFRFLYGPHGLGV
jgi:hypothetical protein